jgi:predicted GIY-YIG superfamily endonuclease
MIALALWLENPTISVLLIAVAFYLLYKGVTTQKHLRHHQHSNGNNVERELFGHKFYFFVGIIYYGTMR